MKKEKILLTGATGFTGGYILEKLLRQKERYDISIFARSKEKISQLGYDKLPINILYGSFEETNRLKKAFAKQDILINIVSLGLGHTNTIIQTCQEENIKPGIFISTTSIFTKLNPKSKKIRIKAEKIIEYWKDVPINVSALREQGRLYFRNDEGKFKKVPCKG